MCIASNVRVGHPPLLYQLGCLGRYYKYVEKPGGRGYFWPCVAEPSYAVSGYAEDLVHRQPAFHGARIRSPFYMRPHDYRLRATAMDLQVQGRVMISVWPVLQPDGCGKARGQQIPFLNYFRFLG